MTSNPFRQPPPKSGIEIKSKLWIARADGKDSSQGQVRLIGNKDFLWFGRDLSVPLAWIVEVADVGPGFRVVWEDPTSGTTEGGVFCVRTMFGYDKKKRDLIVREISQMLAVAKASGPPAVAAAAKDMPRCEVCGGNDAVVVDSYRIINFLLYWIRRPDRKMLCAEHAGKRFRRSLLANAILGSMGIPGVLVTPFLVLSEGRAGLKRGWINIVTLVGVIGVSLLPLLALVVSLVLLIQQAL